jgi:hypothetical protein
MLNISVNKFQPVLSPQPVRQQSGWLSPQWVLGKVVLTGVNEYVVHHYGQNIDFLS